MIRLRRATPEDVDWLVELYNDDDTEPFLSSRKSRTVETVLDEVERSLREPQRIGRMIVELDGERAGVMAFDEVNEANRIAHLGFAASLPDNRRTGHVAALPDLSKQTGRVHLFHPLRFLRDQFRAECLCRKRIRPPAR